MQVLKNPPITLQSALRIQGSTFSDQTIQVLCSIVATYLLKNISVISRLDAFHIAQGSTTYKIIYTTEYYSILKMKEILSCSTTWVKPEDTVLSETNQPQ